MSEYPDQHAEAVDVRGGSRVARGDGAMISVVIMVSMVWGAVCWEFGKWLAVRRYAKCGRPMV